MADDDDDDEERPLIAARGERFVVAANGQAVLMCRTVVCCVWPYFSYVGVPDGTVVQVGAAGLAAVDDLDRVVGVSVVSSALPGLQGRFGCIMQRCLRPYARFTRRPAPRSAPRTALTVPVHDPVPPRAWWPAASATTLTAGRTPAVEAEPGPPPPAPAEVQPAQAQEASKRSSAVKEAAAWDAMRALQDGRSRAYTGKQVDDVVRRFAAKLGVTVVSTNVFQGARVDKGVAVVDLIGGGEDRAVIDVEAPDTYVVDGNGKIRKRAKEARRLLLKRQVQVTIDDHGRLAAVRPGDLMMKVGIMTVGIRLRSETFPGRVATDERGRPVVVVGADGRPVRRDGQWLVRRHDEWIVVSVLSKSVWIGIDAPANA
ncbi:Uncharacterized protein PBTT_08377 [Plasmodiophora brassicae]